MNNIDLSNLNPTWDEERKAVFIPIIGKYLDAKHSVVTMDWHEAMIYAMKSGKKLPGRHEMYAIMFYADFINGILEKHGGDPLTECVWTSSVNSAYIAWRADFTDGNIDYCGVNNYCYVRAICG